jgi:hypothetical protein
MNYPFEKNEYNYYATALIFGKRSPLLKEFSAFSLEIFRTKNLAFSEMEGLDPDSKLSIKRHLTIDNDRILETSHTDMRSSTNRIVTYIDDTFKIHMSDSVFSDEEFEYYLQNWNTTIENKIRTLGTLIWALHVRDVRPIPLMINEYPNITKTLLDRADFFLVGKYAKHK